MEIEVNEEMRINSTIGKVRAIDEDLGENAEIDYAIVDGNDNKIFEVMKSEKKVVPNSILATSDDDDTNSTKEAFVTPPNCEIADSQDKSDIKLQNGDVHQQHLEEKPKTR